MKMMEMKNSGGEGGIRTSGRSFGPYNGLANSAALGPVVWIQRFMCGETARVRARTLLFGNNVATAVLQRVKGHSRKTMYSGPLFNWRLQASSQI
jgi:hypothetical protein